MTLSEIELYKILYRIVRSMPIVLDEQQRELKCRRLQTFAVIKDKEQVNTNGALEKSAFYLGKDIFFSRKWEATGWDISKIQYEYPGLFVWSNQETWANFIQKGGAQNSIIFAFSVMDKMPLAPKGNGVGNDCDSRTYEEVCTQIRQFLQSVIFTLSEFEYVDGLLLNTIIFSGWYHPDELQLLITAGTIDSYNTHGQISSLIRSKDIEAEIYPDMFVDKLAMIVCNIQIDLPECVEAIEMTILPEIKIVADNENGCC